MQSTLIVAASVTIAVYLMIGCGIYLMCRKHLNSLETEDLLAKELTSRGVPVTRGMMAAARCTHEMMLVFNLVLMWPGFLWDGIRDRHKVS